MKWNTPDWWSCVTGLERSSPETKAGDQRVMQKGRTVAHRAVHALRDLGLDDGAIRRLLESELAEISEEVHR